MRVCMRIHRMLSLARLGGVVELHEKSRPRERDGAEAAAFPDEIVVGVDEDAVVADRVPCGRAPRHAHAELRVVLRQEAYLTRPIRISRVPLHTPR